MPSWRNMPSMPNVRDSSGTIGTMYLPIALSRTSVPSICTSAIVVEISRSPELQQPDEVRERRGRQRDRLAPPLRQVAAQRRAPRLQVFRLRAVVRETQVRHLLELLVGDRNLEADRKSVV